MIIPVGNRLLVKELKVAEQTTKGGFIVQDNPDLMTSVRCEVVSYGGECERSWQVGDIVFAIKQAFTGVRESVTDKNVIISEHDVIAVSVPDSAQE